MKAIVCNKYGSPDVLQFQEVEKPAPKDDDVLICQMATKASTADSGKSPTPSLNRGDGREDRSFQNQAEVSFKALVMGRAEYSGGHGVHTYYYSARR